MIGWYYALAIIIYNINCQFFELFYSVLYVNFLFSFRMKANRKQIYLFVVCVAQIYISLETQAVPSLPSLGL